MKILVTGAAGFIGMHVTKALLQLGHEVIGVDSLHDYYSPALKRDRLSHVLQSFPRAPFECACFDLTDTAKVHALFARHAFARVVHLAAQPGVRYSIDHPHAYINSNVVAFLNVLEGCRRSRVPHLVYASSSSIYGDHRPVPFRESEPADHPVSLYAATKKANELMAHTYSHLYGLPATGLRFFTVYGPWGRPDMAPMLFAKAILAGEPLQVFNHGKLRRDFTYVDDIVRGVVAALDRIPEANSAQDNVAGLGSDRSWAPYRVFNIGRGQPTELLQFIRLLESALGKAARLDMQPMQPGDVTETYADTSSLEAWTGVRPQVSLEEGVARFVDWYRAYAPSAQL